MKTLRLILGDQLNYKHSWYTKTDDQICYLMAEMRQETDYVRHHIQKVIAFFDAMRKFADHLKSEGHELRYFHIDDSDNPQELPALIHQVLEETGAEKFEYQLPDEYRLDQQLKEFTDGLDIEVSAVDTEHFYTSREELAEFFKGKKQILMESFYRMMREKHGVLMDGEQPAGGQWNYDKENRKKWKGSPEIPEVPMPNKDLSELEGDLKDAGVKTIGKVTASEFPWPTTRQEGLDLLEFFCSSLLPHFGDYQDALHTDEPFLFHSRLSFALNSKLISPSEVVDRVEAVYRTDKDRVDISQVEGFIRQILGWREYMRGIYWMEMPEYADKNELDNHNALPDFFWTGETKMNCLKSAITQSLEHAYAHHIQRLMITGNFALLAGVHPDEVDAWYLGIYIDALQWVEITNTRGMSQYADGGLLATKPYVSSANYINKMGNYCSSCSYDHKAKLGENACPFNALYWNFLAEKQDKLGNNPRMGMMYSLLNRKDKEELKSLRQRAAAILENPDNF
ncbi:deoxyribodipyrimidine photolyase-related protein [Robiginitalea myxolifaciens]|uniref:Deoxyribodipyrimidine photolyase-related protein n=1 Tax=Robiginitalea myxolifaciens TaxID=400055 RepID=A0A1I6FPQ2_9FLAO|nr:cryptochrome/photolyase family protein [Robiginitalea myxolifaciens]SFR31906.1 deoxyribodipyrimidine photolyase-related protein [Robiginitalea myxolifaciens]